MLKLKFNYHSKRVENTNESHEISFKQLTTFDVYTRQFKILRV